MILCGLLKPLTLRTLAFLLFPSHGGLKVVFQQLNKRFENGMTTDKRMGK